MDALADCMERMITDKGLRDKISRASLEFARVRFNVESIGKEVGLLYENVLNVLIPIHRNGKKYNFIL